MRRSRTTAWIALAAMLLHVLAMPLAGSLSAETKRLLGWGGYCPLAQQLEHAGHAQVAADQDDSAPAAHHASMPQCCCGAGFAGLAALPSATPPLPIRVLWCGCACPPSLHCCQRRASNGRRSIPAPPPSPEAGCSALSISNRTGIAAATARRCPIARRLCRRATNPLQG
ncbi:hypothetical protein SSTU70S_02707 [Stutzerimonas stutzeri]